MPPKCKTPPGQAGFAGAVPLAGNGPQNAPNALVAQAKIELLLDEIGHNVSALQAVLDCALAMQLAGDTTGTVYSLRRAKSYWRHISVSAAELVAADAERLSALRHGEAGR